MNVPQLNQSVPWLLLPKRLVIKKANVSKIKTVMMMSMKCVTVAKKIKVILLKSSVDLMVDLCHVSTMLQLAFTVEWDNATTQDTLGKKSLLH